MDRRLTPDKLLFMPKYGVTPKSLEQVAQEIGRYDLAAYYFVQDGLTATARRLYGPRHRKLRRHITGQELAIGLRDLAIAQWGMLARIVLERWGIFSTMDFGRIVYAMIDAGMMRKCPDDSLEDFCRVYDFRTAFDQTYKIDPQPVKA